MKKVTAIFLSVLLVLCSMPMAFAGGNYNRAEIAQNTKATIDSLTAEQMAGILLDWIDRKIEAATEDFAEFDEYLQLNGFTAPTSLDGIIAYKERLTALGGDFAMLNTEALTTRSQAGSDLQFLYNILAFMAANSDTFGKVFYWSYDENENPVKSEGNFDFGKVGEYIESLESENAVKDFYEDYLIGNDIQKTFIEGIAQEMGYTVKNGETFDDILNNGIKSVVTDWLGSQGFGILSDEAVANVLNDQNYNLRTTDVYTLIKKLCKEIQDDNRGKVKTYFTYACDNFIRPVLKTALGYALTITDEAAPQEVLEQFKTDYDLEVLSELTSADVLYQAPGGSYYSVCTDGTSGKKAEYGESLLNFEPPTVEIWDATQKVGGAYTPTSADTTAYQPTVYTSADYSQYIPAEAQATAEAFGVRVTSEAIPQAVTDIIAAGNGIHMQDKLVMKINGAVMGNDLSQSIEISFAEVEAVANQALTDNLSTIQAQVDNVVNSAVSMANTMPFIGGSVTGKAIVNSITVELAYTGYSDADTFVCEITAVPHYDITYTGNVWSYASMVGMTKDKIEADYIQPAVESVVQNPVATVTVDNLNGTVEGLDSITALMDFFNTDFDVTSSILDVYSDYDAYKGAIGQVNRILCDTVKMLVSETAYTDLSLQEGGNQYLTANVQKLCNRLNTLVSAGKAYMDETAFAEFADAISLSDAFASAHGFNAGMLYDLDFSSVENVYVCGIRMGCDLLVPDDENSILYQFHILVEELDTLEKMAVALFNEAMPVFVNQFNEAISEVEIFKGYDLSLSFTATKDAKTVADNTEVEDYIFGTLTDMLYSWLIKAVPVVNGVFNSVADDLLKNTGIAAPAFNFELKIQKGATNTQTLENIMDRFCELTNGFFRNEVATGNLAAVLNGEGDWMTKTSALATDFLPLAAMFSNAGKDGVNGSVDVAYLTDVLFSQCLDGNFDNFLRLFETKEDEIAGNVSVTYALIQADKHMVEPVFPGTVVPAQTTQNETCQQSFTSRENDVIIASQNMISIYNNRVELMAWALNLVREAGLLPYLCRCEANHHTYTEADWTEETAVIHTATTLTNGEKAHYTCCVCGAYLDSDGNEISDLTIAVAHDYSAQNPTDSLLASAATCKSAAVYYDSCTVCGKAGTQTFAYGTPVAHNFSKLVSSEVAPRCNATGKEAVYQCAWCNATTGGATIAKTAHTSVAVAEVPASCTEGGTSAGHKCSVCGEILDGITPISALGHEYGSDNKCIRCEEEKELSFFQKIAAFFQNIINWFKNLFG